MRSLIDVVPFGVDDDPPVRRRPALKGVVPGINPEDTVLLWGGGVWNWFDAQLAVRAVHQLRELHPGLRLVFLGTRHPNPDIPVAPELRLAMSLAEELDLAGRFVFFNEGWVPRGERADYLLDSDIGISAHHAHVETDYSFRTRYLDYFWAHLPIVATGGDPLGDVIAERGAGIVVPPGDLDAFASALDRMVSDPDLRDRARTASGDLADEFRWARALAPLLGYCRDPSRSPDTSWREEPSAPPPAVGESRPGPLGRAFRRLRGDLRRTPS